MVIISQDKKDIILFENTCKISILPIANGFIDENKKQMFKIEAVCNGVNIYCKLGEYDDYNVCLCILEGITESYYDNHKKYYMP